MHMEDPFGELEMEQLARENAILQLENALLEGFWDRVGFATVQESQQEDESKKKAKPKKTRGTRAVEELTMEQKIEIAASEVADAKKLIEEKKEAGDKLLDDLKAFTEEADVKLAELRKEVYEFKRDVGNQSAAAGKSTAERVARWMEEQQRLKETVTEKLNVKNAQLRVMIQKQETQLQQKEEMGEGLHVIDFDQLKIENQQYLKKIEERNAELLQLKLTTGNIVQVLNSSKRKLSSVVTESVSLRSMITERQLLLSRILDEITKVESDKTTARKLNAKITRQMAESAMPAVLEYVQTKAAQFALQGGVRNLGRKVEVAEMQLRRQKKTLTGGGARGGGGTSSLSNDSMTMMLQTR